VIAEIDRFSVMEKKVWSDNTYYISCLVPFKRISKTDTFLISQIDTFPHLIKQEWSVSFFQLRKLIYVKIFGWPTGVQAFLRKRQT